MTTIRATCALLPLVVLASCASAPQAMDSVFVTRTSSRSPVELHQAIRTHAAQKKWLYIGDNKLKNGEVTQVRLCIREAAADVWKVGMHVAVILPCGQFAIYEEGGMRKVTMLHPRYMTAFEPHAIVRKLADDVAGPFTAMLDEVVK